MLDAITCPQCGAKLSGDGPGRSLALHTGRVISKVALVTGAASGIGRATATVLARHGAAVVCADIATAGAEDTAMLIAKDRLTASAIRLDVTLEPDWQAAMEQICCGAQPSRCSGELRRHLFRRASNG